MLIVCYETAIAISTEPKNQIPYEFITMIVQSGLQRYHATPLTMPMRNSAQTESTDMLFFALNQYVRLH
ncbi:MAG: hypothetical protein KDF62_04495 [Nitrosomonas sp.]|nr:hypothetical protein [Nitrosomonas sp.]